jgi:putative addiction module killer protein
LLSHLMSHTRNAFVKIVRRVLYLFGYKPMIELIRSSEFDAWLIHLRDIRAKERILARLASARDGNLGDWKFVGEGVGEMRIDVGAGYRVYFTRRNAVVYLLLTGGDKSSQQQDIKRAVQMARDLKARVL